MPSTAFEMVLTDDRSLIHDKIADLPDGTRVTFRRPTRSLSQNAKMWAMLDDLHKQVIWYGQRLSPTDWKDVMTASLRKSRVVPTIDGDGLVPLGLHTHEMSDEEMSALIELMHAFGAEQHVKWKASKWFEERVKEMRRR